MLQHSRDPQGRPRRRTSGDPRGDQHARGLARGRRARPVHRDAVARPSARPPHPRHGRTRSRRPRAASVDRFYRRHYVPGHLVVAAAGNLRHEDLMAHAARADGDRRASSPQSDPSVRKLRTRRTLTVASGRNLTKRRKTEQAHICLGTNGLPRADADRFAFLIVTTALGGGMSSRLFQEIREKRGLAYCVYAYHAQYTEAGLVSCYAGTTPTPRPRDRRPAAPRGRGRPRRRPHRRGVRAREGPRSGLHRAVARGPGRPDVAAGQVGDLARRDPLAWVSPSSAIDRVTLEDAQRVAHRVLSQPMTLTVLGPFGKTAFVEAMA